MQMILGQDVYDDRKKKGGVRCSEEMTQENIDKCWNDMQEKVQVGGSQSIKVAIRMRPFNRCGCRC